MAKRYVRLLEIRVSEKAFHPNGEQEILDITPSVFAVLRISPDKSSRVLSLINVTNENVTLHVPLDKVGFVEGEMKDLSSGEQFTPEAGPWEFRLNPYQVAWLTW